MAKNAYLTVLTDFNRFNGHITENGPDEDTPRVKLPLETEFRPNRPGSFRAYPEHPHSQTDRQTDGNHFYLCR